MNNVSLLLYITDVVGNLSVLFSVSLIIGGAAAIFLTAFFAIELGGLRWWHYVLYVCLFFWAIGLVLIPTKTTILAIASSEFIEDFSKTETGTEIGSLAQDTLKLLRKQLNELNKEE